MKKKDKAPPAPPIVLTKEQETMLMIFSGLALFSILSGHGRTVPKWVKDLPPLHGRKNAAWRGKGSYGKAPFGKQMGHRAR